MRAIRIDADAEIEHLGGVKAQRAQFVEVGVAVVGCCTHRSFPIEKSLGEPGAVSDRSALPGNAAYAPGSPNFMNGSAKQTSTTSSVNSQTAP